MKNTQQNHQIDNLRSQLNRYQYILSIDKGCFIGIGGGGINIVSSIKKYTTHHTFLLIDNNLQVLKKKNIQYNILLKNNNFLGCGNKIICAKRSITNQVKKQLYTIVENENNLYIIITLGGGIGSGSSIKILQYLSKLEKNILVFVVLPFSFEGRKRNEIARNALKKIQENSLLKVFVLKNDNILNKTKNATIGFYDSMQYMNDEVLKTLFQNIDGFTK